MVDGSQYPKCYEPYLRYAVSTDFRNFELFDESSFALLLLVELHQADRVAEFARMMAKRAALGPEFGDAFPHVEPTRYVTMRASKPAVTDRDVWPIWDKFVSRVELSLPVKPKSIEDFVKETKIIPRFEGARKLLIGVLDDGCPFAAAQFLTTSTSGKHTRVRGIWDQNRDKKPAKVNGGSLDFGRELLDFGFGVEYLRNLPAPSPGLIGLDDWLNNHTTSSHVTDEAGCYADAGFTTLARRISHGAHVLDVLAGLVPPSSRIAPPADRRDPPSWKPGADPAAGADVVFVQFSDACIRDATGVWLKDYVVEGIKYILSFAKPGVTRHVIVNLSYGPTTGPHDGSALLEDSLHALIREFNGRHKKPKLEIVLAAGNAYFSEGHVSYTRRTAAEPDTVEWIWRLPPDNSVLCFAEIWMETAAAGDASITLTPPSGGPPVYVPTVPPTTPPSLLPPAGVDIPLVRGGNTMWRLHVESTLAQRETYAETAEHGDWRIKVTGIGVHAHVHAYVARSDPNMGVRSGAKRSYFVDPRWQQQDSASAAYKYVDGEFDSAGSLVNRFGTLNGIATGKPPRIHVAGGFVMANQRKSAYSSAGPARNPPPHRIGPDVVLPCDESYALGGIRGGGNRTGSRFRLTGTSVAAPQLARHLTITPNPTTHDHPTTPAEKRKRGRGNVDAP